MEFKGVEGRGVGDFNRENSQAFFQVCFLCCLLI